MLPTDSLSHLETVWMTHALRPCIASLYSGGYPCLWKLRCELVEGKVVLHGVVSNYYMKQLAQEMVRSTGTAEVENRIEVRISPQT